MVKKEVREVAHYLDTEKYLNAVCLMLRQGNSRVPVPVAGNSMRPFLKTGDTVFLDAIHDPVKVGDILLFQKENGQYVLHRVVKCRADGSFLLLGDNQVKPEPVTAEQLRARVSAVRIGAQTLAPGDRRWWLFSHPWRWLRPFRGLIGKMHNWLHK